MMMMMMMMMMIPKTAIMVTVDHRVPDLTIELIDSPCRICHLPKLKIINYLTCTGKVIFLETLSLTLECWILGHISLNIFKIIHVFKTGSDKIIENQTQYLIHVYLHESYSVTSSC